MPILWRYLLRSFFQVLLLCIGSFISILLVMRFQEIARFATSGASLYRVLLFALFQIPYILPIAIPISALIAAILLFQRLSHTHELTAFRAAGIGLRPIITPILLAAAVLSLINFTITSELATRCRGQSKDLVYEMATLNPLFLFQKESLVKLKNSYVEMRALKAGKYAEDLIVVAKNSSSNRLALIVAKELSLDGDLVHGERVSVISTIDTKNPASADHFVIEHQKEMNTKAANLSRFVRNADWQAKIEYLPLRSLLAMERVDPKRSSSKSWISKTAMLEISRRLSLSLATLSFTLIGIAFGIEISRNRSKKGVLWAIALSAFYLISFVMAKSLRHSPVISALIYLLVPLLLTLPCLRSLKSMAEGAK